MSVLVVCAVCCLILATFIRLYYPAGAQESQRSPIMKKSQKNTTCTAMMNCVFSLHNRTRSSCIVLILFEDPPEFCSVIPPSQIVIAPVNMNNTAGASHSRGAPWQWQVSGKDTELYFKYFRRLTARSWFQTVNVLSVLFEPRTLNY